MSSEMLLAEVARLDFASRPGKNSTRLSGLPLAAGRLLWLVLVLGATALFTLGMPARADELRQQYAGSFPADLSVEHNGVVHLSMWQYNHQFFADWGAEQLVHLGVLEGDALVAVDGVPVRFAPGQALPDGWLAGPIGSLVAITVRTGDGPARTYSLLRGGPGADSLAALGITGDFVYNFAMATEILFAAVFIAIGAVIFWRRSDDWLALLASASSIMLFVGASSPVISITRATPSAGDRLDEWFLLAIVSLLTFLYLFPGGRFFQRWTAGAAALLALWVIIAPLVPDLYPWHLDPLPDLALIFITIGSGVLAQVLRYRTLQDTRARLQTKWVLFGVGAATAGLVAKYWLQVVDWPPPTVLVVTMYNLIFYPPALLLQMLLPLGMLFAIVRYRLFDIDTIINRTLVYGSLTAVVFGLYVLIVTLLGALFQTSTNLVLSLPATAVAAVIFQPLRERLQRAVNRLMYGERDEPYSVISRLGTRLEGAFEPSAVLPAIVETVAQALKLPYVAITLREGEQVKVGAQYGTGSGDLLRLPLTYAGANIGEMLLAPRSPGEEFTPGDRKLLQQLAQQAGAAANAVLLHDDLERSRRRIVEAREEARRKLGSDLHDGVGHRLAGLLRRQELAASLLQRDPAAAEATLREVASQTRSAIDNVRQLAHKLHPPELELLGLAGALRERVQQLGYEGAEALRITVDAPQVLPPLPVAVEVAAYYIAQEALTNVTRHAGATHVSVRLHAEAWSGQDAASSGAATGEQPATRALQLEVVDDGKGLPAEQTDGQGKPGLGLASMRERAAELGGKVTIEPRPGGGTIVFAWLPCPVCPPDEPKE